MAGLTPRGVLLGNPVEAGWKVDPTQLAALLEQMQTAAATGIVASQSAAALDNISVGDSDRWAIVRGAADKTEDGYYFGSSDSGEWELVAPLGDSFAVAEIVAGTGNAIELTLSDAASISTVTWVIFVPEATNSAGAMTVVIDGGSVEALTNGAGGTPQAGDFIAGVPTAIFRPDTESAWKQFTSSRDVAGLDHQGAYSGAATYTRGQVVSGSDGNWYQVQSLSVSGEDPVGSSSGDWLKIFDLSILGSFMVGSNNLSEVTNQPTARQNIGLKVDGGALQYNSGTIASAVWTAIKSAASNVTFSVGETGLTSGNVQGAMEEIVAVVDELSGKATVQLGTSTSSISVTAIDFTSLPSGIKEILISFNQVSDDTGGGSNDLVLQLGSGGSPQTSGYAGSSENQGVSATVFSSAFYVALGLGASSKICGHVLLTLEDETENRWVFSTNTGSASDSSGNTAGGGMVSLGGELDMLRIVSESGSATFDNGTINISYKF